MPGERRRFEELIEDYHDEIFRYLWRLVSSSGGDPLQEAQDLTQDVFMKAYRAYERTRPDSNYRAWLYRIATNAAYSMFKRAKRITYQALPDEDWRAPADPALQPEQFLELSESLDEIKDALLELPLKQQAAVVMRHLQELDYADIARALDCSEESARANVYQGLRRLRRDLTVAERGQQ